MCSDRVSPSREGPPDGLSGRPVAPAISVRGVGKCYRVYASPFQRLLAQLGAGALARASEHWALRDVDLELKRGATVGIIGENGSGKSTLLQVIAGTLKPTCGSVTTHGRVAALLELGAGFNPEFTGRENVRMTAALYGLNPDQVSARMASIEAFAEIGEYIDRPVKTYSSGMFVRLAFAVIAHVDADVLIVDEALAVGDAYFTQKCMRFLKRFMSSGSVLFVSHDMTAVRSLASEVVWLERGRVVECGPAKAVGDAYLRALYARHQPVDGVGPAAETVGEGIADDAPVLEAVTTRRVRPRQPPDFRAPVFGELAPENRFEVFRYSPDPAASFGDGAAGIVSAALCDASGRHVPAVAGGEEVLLTIDAAIHRPLVAPIMGFLFRNRLGQNVFGDNTFLSLRNEPLDCASGGTLRAGFAFRMPFLPAGDYSICVAVASGSLTDHVQHHWVNDAIMIRSLCPSVHADVIGIPMHEISLTFQAGGAVPQEAAGASK